MNFWPYLHRLSLFLFMLLLASFILFFLLEFMPGDAASLMLGIEADEATLNALREQMGLNKPIFQRYFDWLWGIIEGDFGMSYSYNIPVSTLIQERIAVSLPLAVMALFFTLMMSLPFGIWAAVHQQKRRERVMSFIAYIALAVPNFWLAILLLLFFSLTLGWFPAMGFDGWSDVWQAINALILPAMALAIPQSAILYRMTRATMIETLGQDFLRTAKAKGAGPFAVVMRHAFPHACLNILTLLGLQLSFLIAGTVIIENVFSLPGIGRLLFQAILQRDLMTLKGTIFLIILFISFVNFMIDLIALFLDPRLKSKAIKL